jgi:prepilin-type N-terminal cleavage/methylation domain-containing protein
MRTTKSGFTIVELLIVIVVIAILAAITVVTYSGIRSRANDARRISDANAIVKAIHAYLAENGTLPPFTSVGGSWEQSYTEPAGQFMEYLDGYGISGSAPVDPVNNSTYHYRYYRYSAGTNGCDTTRGRYFVFGIYNIESSSGPHPDSPGFSCSGRNWTNEFDWVTGGFEN